jgi:hypothetical protein
MRIDGPQTFLNALDSFIAYFFLLLALHAQLSAVVPFYAIFLLALRAQPNAAVPFPICLVRSRASIIVSLVQFLLFICVPPRFYAITHGILRRPLPFVAAAQVVLS